MACMYIQVAPGVLYLTTISGRARKNGRKVEGLLTSIKKKLHYLPNAVKQRMKSRPQRAHIGADPHHFCVRNTAHAFQSGVL